MAQDSGRGENQRAPAPPRGPGQGEQAVVLDVCLGWVSFGQLLPHVEAPALDCNNANENAGNVKLFGGRKNTGKVRLQGAAPGRWKGKDSFHFSPCSSSLLLPTNHCRETPRPLL